MNHKILSARRDIGQIPFPVHKLYPISNRQQHTDQGEVTASVYNWGMEWPIIAYEIRVVDWDQEAARNHLILPPPPNLELTDIVLQVRCGNKRWRYAKDLGYTHIETYIAKSLDEVAQLMKEQQDWFKKNKEIFTT